MRARRRSGCGPGSRTRPSTRSSIALNGRTLAEVRGAGVERPSAHVVPFAASDLAPIMNTFELWADYRFEESAPRHPIGRTGVALPADVEVRAARERATVRVNGRLLRPDRGYLLAVLDPDTGEIVDLGRFDTSWYAAEAARLAAFVEALPDGTPVVVATEFDASRALTPAAVAAFRTLGLEVDLQGQFQVMHAAVGVKGAPPGSALEASGPLQAAVDLGRPDIREVELRSLLLR
jgi:hypothetical protein